MINGYHKGELSGSGMVVWKGRELLAAGEMTRDEFIEYVATGYVYCEVGLKITHVNDR